MGDILDRASIARLKHERIREEETHREWKVFQEELNISINRYKIIIPVNMFFDLLYKINAMIWELESDLRQGKLDGVLSEVGRRAIEIRKLNSLRVSVKNIVNTVVKEGFIDIKSNHLSQNE